MSGGIAYVLDEDDTFESRCNMSMVELEPVLEEDDLLERSYHLGGDLEHPGFVDVMSDLTRFDALRLRRLVTLQARYTGSARATEILQNWSDYLPKFRKVMPIEYRRALSELEAREEEAPRLAAAGE
jgi:glutamate synthase (NADPH/NADH) large chain